jgi:putative hydrolase of the HAD superfamily
MYIVFDLGGVVVRWEPELILREVFDDLPTRAQARDGILNHPDWVELDRGTLPRSDAISRAVARTGLSEAQVHAFLQHVPPSLVAVPESVRLLYHLKQRGHTLFCLSNMHLASIEHLESTYDFWPVFTGVVISCRIHLCKPEAAIYQHLLKTYRLEGPSTVFIDDTQENLTAAGQLGIQTIKFENASQCERALAALERLS